MLVRLKVSHPSAPGQWPSWQSFDVRMRRPKERQPHAARRSDVRRSDGVSFSENSTLRTTGQPFCGLWGRKIRRLGGKLLPSGQRCIATKKPLRRKVLIYLFTPLFSTAGPFGCPVSKLAPVCAAQIVGSREDFAPKDVGNQVDIRRIAVENHPNPREIQ